MGQREGRAAELIPAALEGERVDRVVAMITGLPRSRAAELVGDGGVSLNRRPVMTGATRVHEGDTLEIGPEAAGASAGPSGDCPPDPTVAVPVVHADDHVIVVDKPPGMVTHPGAGHRDGTLVQGLLAEFPEMAGVGDPQRPGIVHRLDKDTSGLLVVARTAGAHAALGAQMTQRTVERRYLALALGLVEPPAGVIDAPLGRARRDPTRVTVTGGGREARTRFEVVARWSEPLEATLLSCRLETGRTHQVRVHLAAIGHPVLGDARYGGARRGLAVPRTFLHAALLGFDHPASGERVRFRSELPDDLEAVLEAFR